MNQHGVHSFREWLDLVGGILPELGRSKSLALAGSCCERMLPNYRAFVVEENWGDPRALAAAPTMGFSTDIGDDEERCLRVEGFTVG